MQFEATKHTPALQSIVIHLRMAEFADTSIEDRTNWVLALLAIALHGSDPHAVEAWAVEPLCEGVTFVLKPIGTAIVSIDQAWRLLGALGSYAAIAAIDIHLAIP
jgi:hypothetical protein